MGNQTQGEHDFGVANSNGLARIKPIFEKKCKELRIGSWNATCEVLKVKRTKAREATKDYTGAQLTDLLIEEIVGEVGKMNFYVIKTKGGKQYGGVRYYNTINKYARYAQIAYSYKLRGNGLLPGRCYCQKLGSLFSLEVRFKKGVYYVGKSRKKDRIDEHGRKFNRTLKNGDLFDRRRQEWTGSRTTRLKLFTSSCQYLLKNC
uniref:GIY-YIG domain-containing protein n=1 Tax=Rhabditophanes sp. KR3021 TaxID=114890 RepID=A0AC35UH85_9BILA